MTTRHIRIAGAVLALGLTFSGLSACGSDDPDSGSTGAASGSGEAKKIALLLPENKTARYEAFDGASVFGEFGGLRGRGCFRGYGRGLALHAAGERDGHECDQRDE